MNGHCFYAFWGHQVAKWLEGAVGYRVCANYYISWMFSKVF